MKRFVGTCASCFGEDNECIIDTLPWSTLDDFTRADETAVEITEAAFNNRAQINPILATALHGHELTYLSADDGVVLMIYDGTTDTHFIFV